MQLNKDFKKFVEENFFIYKINVVDIAQVFISCKKDSNNHSLEQCEINFAPTANTIKVNPDFAYGGSRLATFLPDLKQGIKQAIKSVSFLAIAESHLKHKIINQAVIENALSEIIDYDSKQVIKHLAATNDLQSDVQIGYQIPEKYLDLEVRGARCLILPNSKIIEEILKDPTNLKFIDTINPILNKIGNFLNGTTSAELVDQEGYCLENVFLKRGAINLTPDFGKYSKIADMLCVYTPQVLCLSAEAGGSSGKVAYTVTSILAGIEAYAAKEQCSFDSDDSSITLIGSAGALGSGIVEYLANLNFKNVRISDLQYDDAIITDFQPELLENFTKISITKSVGNDYTIFDSFNKITEIKIGDRVIITKGQELQKIPRSWEVIDSTPHKFTDEALNEKNIIIATTIGREIENSNYHLISPGTVFFAAHNIALPIGNNGVKIVRELHKKNIKFVPGQILTLGGALTSRLEACYREFNNITLDNCGTIKSTFPKRLGHEITRLIVNHVCNYLILNQDSSEWESLLNFANLNALTELQDNEMESMLLNSQFIPYDLRY